MQKKSTSEFGFFNPRVLIALLFSAAAACSVLTGASLAFFGPNGSTKVSNRTLSFAERVSYQRAIEEVYWRHRIWPKERPDPKPSLDAVMSQAQVEKKVADYLRNSQALEDYWQRPITAGQLQAEMERIAQHTKQPDVLRELFEALGNDPFVIAESLARPALSERLVTNWYAHDQRIHGELEQRAQAELQAHPTVEQMKQLDGKYREIEFVRGDSAQGTANHSHEHSVKLNPNEWDEMVQNLARTVSNSSVAAAVSAAQATRLPLQKPALASTVSRANGASITQVKTGALSPLQEDEEGYYATAVLSKTKDRLKLATVSWRKQPFESWLTRAENQVPNTTAAGGGHYTLPKISEGGCIDDTWTATNGPPDRRESQTAVWTGAEMIVWGGQAGNSIFFNTGGRYNPSTDSWTAISATNAPDARTSHTAVWTGSEMIVWGGVDENFVELNTGGRYNPGTGDWIPTSTTNAPDGRNAHTAVWSGSEMIVWGGGMEAPFLTPAEDTIPTPTVGPLPAPSTRLRHELLTRQCGLAVE